jgi:hypothetical protein
VTHPEWREELAERAAIIEADTGCTRVEADERAEAIVRRRHAAAASLHPDCTTVVVPVRSGAEPASDPQGKRP